MEEVRFEEIQETLQNLLSRKDYRALKVELAELYPMDIAEIFENIPADDCIVLFRLLHKDQAAEVFSYIGQSRRADIVTTMQTSLLEHILDELFFDDKIDFLEEMPANFVTSIMADFPKEERELIHQFMHFPENSAGRLMTIEYVSLKKNMTIRQALDKIKQVGLDKETIYTCYVLDDTRKLEGIVSLRRLVLEEDNLLISEIMHEDVVLAQITDDQEEVAELFKKYDLMAVPVVDNEKRLIGIITIDDIVDVIEKENTEDFQRMAAMQPSDEEYLKTKVFTLAKRRIVWLLILMVSATFTGGIITHYNDLLSSAVLLAAFIPMLMDSGGNAGSQSSTLIIRGIALGEIETSDWTKVVWREFRVGLVVGFSLSAVNFLRMMIFGPADFLLAVTVSVTLVFTIVSAKLMGGILPILAKKVKLDPAIMAGPLITTVVDAFSLIIYFSLASVLIL